MIHRFLKDRVLAFLIMCLLTVAVVVGCTSQPDSDQKQRVQQEQLNQQATDAVGMPHIANFFERNLLRKILEMRDDPNLINYLYTRNEYTGKYVYLGRVVGFGIPYATQYTNPERVENPYHGAWVTLPQADPNTLFSPASAEATWILYVDETDGKQHIAYGEERLHIRETKMPRRLVEEWSLPANY